MPSNALDHFGNGYVPTKPGVKAFNPYAAGHKVYGAGRPMPNVGPVGDPRGYSERDNKAQARKSAILRRLKGQQSGNPMDFGIIGFGTGVFR